MKALARATAKKSERTAKTGVLFRKFLIEPMSNGLYGFALFFSVLLITKFLSLYLGVQDEFVVDFGDVILSSIGFVLLFLIKTLENLGRSKN